MPVNYGLLDPNAPEKLGAIFNPNVIQERKNTLAGLANQQLGQQIQTAQGIQALNAPAQQQVSNREKQKEINAQKLNAGIANDIQSGITKEIISSRVSSKAKQMGFNDAEIQEALTPLNQARDSKSAHEHYFSAAFPDIVAKQRAEQMYPKPESDKPGEAQRGQIIFDSKGNAFNVNPYTNEVRPVNVGGQQIQGAQYSPALQGDISGARASGGTTGKATGEASATLSDIESQMPQLEKLVSDLSAIGKKATYTKVGQAADIVRRQSGMSVGEGAIARKEYISKVDNEILPLLRQTFGAAFTQKEGETLKATLGDPDASPEEKDMVLKSFIQTKKQEVGSLKRRMGQPTEQPNAQYDQGKEARYQAWKAQQGAR
jgi:hypothetical protein